MSVTDVNIFFAYLLHKSYSWISDSHFNSGLAEMKTRNHKNIKEPQVSTRETQICLLKVSSRRGCRQKDFWTIALWHRC